MVSVQQIRGDLADWYREITVSLMDHRGRLGQGFESPVAAGRFEQWLSGYSQQQGLDESTHRALERHYSQIQKEVRRMLERQQHLMKSRLALVGIERSYRQLDQLLEQLA